MGGVGALSADEPQPLRASRRALLGALGVGWLADQVLPDTPPIAGRLHGASHRVGHLLRDGGLPPLGGQDPAVDVVIVGSGISGLSAAWRLERAGLRIAMLELERFIGGTSSWSDAGAVPHPWGAHYLPVPEKGARAARRLLRELDLITGWDAAGRPVFDPEHLCHAPEERLHFAGAWHEGLVPVAALSGRERADMDRFRALQQQLLRARGRDGRPAFASPASESSRDPRYLSLDTMSAADWLTREGLTSPFVRWYVGYATRDDFGGNIDDVSAWAMLHYFAARKLDSDELAGSRYLVWPEGNGFLARRLRERFHGTLRTGALVTALEPQKDGVQCDYVDVARGERRRVAARAVVLAIPGFVARRVLPGGLAEALPRRATSPWLVANLHVERPPDPNRVWDSILHDSPGLGYVDAGHQRTSLEKRTVLTYFRAFGARDVRASRAAMLARSWSGHAGDVMLDLGRVHPELPGQTRRVDIMLWGHAMPRPRPGFLGSNPLEPLPDPDPRIAFAHVDRTGFALFEEANAHGVRAAERVGKTLGLDLGTTWA